VKNIGIGYTNIDLRSSLSHRETERLCYELEIFFSPNQIRDTLHLSALIAQHILLRRI